MEVELRRALERGELSMDLQPVVRVSTGLVVGAEALVRWQHPRLGPLLPGAFLPLAERSGLIAPLGEWVLSEAIAQRATWPDGLFVSVNLSPAELASAPARDLVGHIRRACTRSGVAPSDVWIEVTEQPIDDLESTTATLTGLRDLGVRIVLDDFGSGYASLTRLRDLPFDVCKLDRSFVAGMAGEGGVRVVRAAVAMARAFGTEVVAEGVETAHQLDQLDALGCDLVQGYHLHRPASDDEVRRLLTAQAATVRHRDVGPVPEPSHVPGEAAGRGDHRVLYYDDEDTLIGWVADALAAPLGAGDPALILATAEHRDRITAALLARGTDVDGLAASGRLVQFDADTTLDLITEDGVPVGQRLGDLVAELVPTDGRPLWVFGEMVALLWGRGDAAAAMALEEAWNECLADRAVALLCAYPSADVVTARSEAAFERIAQRHRHVVVGGRSWQLDAAAVTADPAGYVRELRSALAETALAVRAQARLEQELRDLQERIEASERFGTMVVHEIRNPASVLTLTLDALREERGSLSEDEARHLLGLATSSAHTIGQLAADLLRAAKLEAADFAATGEPIDLAATVATVLARARLVTGREIRCATTGPLPTVLADADRQQQILLNLLDNAVACSPAGSPVQLDIQVGSEHLEVRVADAGPGVAPDDRQRLFEPFTQLASSASRADGAGLGLYIVDRLVRAQGGRIWIEDGPLGGAAFCYTVPLASTNARLSPRPVVDRSTVRIDVR